LNAVGLVDTGHRLRQANDPTDNTLLAFVKPKTASEQDDPSRSVANALHGGAAGERAVYGVRAAGR